MKNHYLKFLVLPLIVLNIFLSSRWVLDGNIFFHTDIARDFLLMEDIVDNKNLTLIGPRSGAIPGLFHGPLWLYLNLPAYLTGNGDPVTVGWFWVSLYIVSLLITYFVAKELFNQTVGLLSVLLLSEVTALFVRSLFNPYGALLLFPIFFYFFYQYIKNKKFKALLIVVLLLGFIIQFQMAFGVPILILTLLFLAFDIYKNRRFFHFLSVFILAIPLSTFILFELRNNFLQVKSVIKYLAGAESHGKLAGNFWDLGILRVKESILDGLGSLTSGNIYLTAILFIIFSLVFFKIFKSKNSKKLIFLLAVYFYLGFWIMTIFFKGPVWSYYYLPFIPLLVIIFTALVGEINKLIFYLLFIAIYGFNLFAVVQDVSTYVSDELKQDVSTWKFNQLIAKRIFDGEEKEFGYFIFTPDLYGYSPRFAMNFYQKRYKDKIISPYVKKDVVYLLIAPPPYYGKDPNSVWYQKNTNSSLWKRNDIRIEKEPESVSKYENDFKVEKYRLTEKEIKIDPNPFLINGIFFR